MKNLLMMLLGALGLSSVVLLFLIINSPGVENATGLAHPQIDKISIGGDGLARITEVGWYGFIFHCLVLAQYILFIVLSVSPRYRSALFYSVLTGTYVIMLVVWSRVYFGHQNFLATGETSYFMGFPTPTAWTTYGIWLSGFPLILLYSFGFKKYIYTKADEEAFKQLLKDFPQSSEGEK